MTNTVFSPTFLNLTASFDLASELIQNPVSGVTARNLGLSESAVSRYSRARQKKASLLPISTHSALPIVAQRSPRTHTDGTKDNQTPWQLGDDKKKRDGWANIAWDHVLPPGAQGAKPAPVHDGMQETAERVVEQLQLIKSASEIFSTMMVGFSGVFTVQKLGPCSHTLHLLVQRLVKLNVILSDPAVNVDVDDSMMRILQMARHNIEAFLSRLSQLTTQDLITKDVKPILGLIVASVKTLASFDGALTQWGVAAAFWHEAYLSKVRASLDPTTAVPHEDLCLAMANLSTAVDALVVTLTQNDFKEHDDGMANLMRQVERVFKSYQLFEYFFGDDETLEADMIAQYLSIDVVLWVNAALGQLAFYDGRAEDVDHKPLREALLSLRSRLIDFVGQRRLFNRHEWASQLLFGRVLPSLEFMGVPSRPDGIEDRVWQSYLGMRQGFDNLLAAVSEGETHDAMILLEAGTVAANAFVHCMSVLVGSSKTPAMQQLIGAWPYLLGDFIQPIDEMMRHLLTSKTEDGVNIRALQEAAQDFSNAITEFASLVDFADRDDGESLGAWAERISQMVEDGFDQTSPGDSQEAGDEDDVQWS
jgi:hypothetical protein